MLDWDFYLLMSPRSFPLSEWNPRLSYQFADAIKDRVNDFLANGVVTTSVVIGRILFARDQLLRVEELAVGSGTNLV